MQTLQAAPNWNTVDQSIKAQKYKQATAQVDGLLKTARTNKDNKNWRQALLLGTDLRFRGNQYEGAVNYLSAQSWPQDKDSQLLINLHKAQLLTRYIGRYRWEIQQREKIASTKKTSLKKKTMDQLVAEINQAFSKAYQLSLNRNEPIESLGQVSLANIKNYFVKTDYPEHIRGGVFDTVTYLWVAFLSDSSLWSAHHSNQTGLFSLDMMLSDLNNVKPENSKIHPLQRSMKLLNNLEQFQRAKNNPEAALEAFRIKLLTLSQHQGNQTYKHQLIQTLRTRINQNNALPWTNMLRVYLAKLIRQQNQADSNIQAITILKQCIAQSNEENKKQRALKFCQYEMANILAPSMQLSSMKTDSVGKRSLQLTHKNINKLYFRAWRIPLTEALSGNHHELMRQLLASKGGKKRQFDAHWEADIQNTGDYKNHITYVTPPFRRTGYWLIAASLKPNFKVADKSNPIASTSLNITRLVADTRNTDSQLDLTAYLGNSGQLAANIQAELWQVNYNQPAKRVAVKSTSKEGRASFDIKKLKQSRLKLVLKHGDDFAITKDNVTPAYFPRENKHTKSALIFTDRAIYRPGQKIKWKIVAYYGDKATGKYKVFAHNAGWIKLLDSNGKQAEIIKFKTNQYGSASGEFTAKTGLKLGYWRLETSWAGRQANSKSIRVEEYKRPTFSANIEKSNSELRINKPVRLTGSARYYFGQPVSSGKVKWRVERSVAVIYSSWRYGRYSQPYRGNETIKSGSAELDNKGKFIINFNPKATTNSDNIKRNYQFKIIADITDSGGETRSATRTFSIGDISIQANINVDKAYANAGEAYSMEINRHDLNGTPRKGLAHWRLHRLQQPVKPLLPAELPVGALNDENDDGNQNSAIENLKEKYKTKGDKLSPRWQAMPDLRSYTKDWKDAGQVEKGTLKHDEKGNANLKLKGLPAGMYRLHYTTKDQWGKAFKLQEMVIVGGQSPAPIKTPLLLKAQSDSVEVGGKVKLLAGSGFSKTPVLFEVYQGNKRLKRTLQRSGIKQIEYPVTLANRGSLTFVLTMIKDYQFIQKTQEVSVPWSDRDLNVTFSTFRDKLSPGQKETWRVTVKDSKDKLLQKDAVELLASMFDKSLEFFGQHNVPNVKGLYRTQNPYYIKRDTSLGVAYGLYAQHYSSGLTYPPAYREVMLKLIGGYYGGVGGNVYHNYNSEMAMAPMAAPAPRPVSTAMRRPAPRVDVYALQRKLKPEGYYNGAIDVTAIEDETFNLQSVSTRKNFNETAFFYPHLVLDDNGSVAFEFEVPESLTQWKVWVSAITKDLRGGSATEFANTSKELMVRPYLPRFLRAGDRAELEVLVNNSGNKPLSGKLEFDVIDPETKKTIATKFKLVNGQRHFNVNAGQSSRLRFSLQTPHELGLVAIRARASANNGKERFSDGEQQPLPILPSRIHLSQSRFAAVLGKNQGVAQSQSTRKVNFSELAKNTDATRINDSLVVTVDGQLFYSTLKALPYLTDYPYECTEQTMNRFLSTSIINSVFSKNPAMASLAKSMSKRKTQYEQWSQVDNDPNHKMLLEETPWLNQAKGGSQDQDKLLRVLDPKVARAQYQSALKKLIKAQTSSGGFPWWQGGRDSPYMTAYLLHGFSRALEFKVTVPKPNIQRAWKYLHKHYKENLKKNEDIQLVTLVNYILSAYPDNSWSGGVFNAQERKTMLDLSFKNWRKLPPLLKAYLALTLKRAGRAQQANEVFDAVMDASTTDQELGTYFAPEDRSWLWYNDSVDTHAFILRAMMELDAKDKRRHGLVQWLMLNKKLNHWKSTRATAESIYALVHYLKQEGQLGQEERLTANVGNHLSQQFVFKPNEYTGNRNQFEIKGDKIKPDMANITFANQGKSLMFASATWHFSTEKLPKDAQGDFFNVSRRFYKRVLKGKQIQLQPLNEGAVINVGDELEVQLSMRSKHAAEFVHLRAPRGAGFEPVNQTSGYQWQTGLGYYEETRDSGANYFFDRLPAGEYSFKYRLRATTAGQFRVAPATVQSIYAPEFNAYSSGKRLTIQNQ